ncbi:hypothetical protein Tco_1254846 [Tanacetum coccineum]
MVSTAWQFKHHPHTLRSPSKPGRANYYTISFPLLEWGKFLLGGPFPERSFSEEFSPLTSVLNASEELFPILAKPLHLSQLYLRTKLEYFNEDYVKELEMEPRLERTREVTPPFRTRSPRVRRKRERVVRFKEDPNRERSRIGRNIKVNGPLEAGAEENRRRDMNLPHFWQPT